jgi:Ser-tRNA(Ala) deacylase AlaX
MSISMLKFWRKSNPSSDTSSEKLTWDDSARQAIQQSLQQAPIPAMLRGKVKKELEAAAEEAARADHKTSVTAQHVMTGMLNKMPANMRAQVEQAMKGGPEEIQKLQQRFRNHK